MKVNGKRPRLEIGLVLDMEDGGQRRILQATPAKVMFVTRKSQRGRFTAKPQELSRKKFWEGVAQT